MKFETCAWMSLSPLCQLVRRTLNKKTTAMSYKISISGLLNSSMNQNVFQTTDQSSLNSLPTPQFQEDNVFDNEAQKISKRERNRLAAQRTRQKKADTIQSLNLHCAHIEDCNLQLKEQIRNLEYEKQECMGKIGLLQARVNFLENLL